MFQPASLKGTSPTPLDERFRKKFIIIYIHLIILSFFPMIIFQYQYFWLFWIHELNWFLILFFPINLIISLYLIQFGAILLSALILTICKLIYLPKEGVFERAVNDKDYKYWNLRNTIKKWPLYVIATNPFPWLKNQFTLRFFGVNIGKNPLWNSSWISSEFVEIGDNCIIGMGSTILSFNLEQDKFIIKKITIKNNVSIGAKCIIMPGTIVNDNVKLAAHSYTKIDQILKKNKLYFGHPAKIK